MKTVKLVLIGYGNVGKAFAKMLKRREAFIKKNYHRNISITAICTKRRGSLIEPGGIDTEKLDSAPFRQDVTAFQVIDEADYDVLIELTPINIKTGMPAIEHIRRGLGRGKHVITANKGPIAWAYRELRDLAEEKNVLFCHEAAVMDGVPVFNLAKETLKGCRITEVEGILNATTNYILNEMEKGVAYEDAVKEGQRRGFVEADPAMDVEGFDAAAKLTALMNVLMDVEIKPTEIQRRGISGISREEIVRLKERGQKYKLLCRGFFKDGTPVGEVSPQPVAADSFYASINGTAACVTVTTDLMGKVTVIEQEYEPEIDQTAYGVLSDLFRILTEEK